MFIFLFGNGRVMYNPKIKKDLASNMQKIHHFQKVRGPKGSRPIKCEALWNFSRISRVQHIGKFPGKFTSTVKSAPGEHPGISLFHSTGSSFRCCLVLTVKFLRTSRGKMNWTQSLTACYELFRCY